MVWNRMWYSQQPLLVGPDGGEFPQLFLSSQSGGISETLFVGSCVSSGMLTVPLRESPGVGPSFP